ncbi:MAG: omega-amidase [Arenicella sp.]|jgi:omega-amidase
MSENIRISLIQSNLHWQEREANLAMFEEKIWGIEGGTDLIVLPEMFNSGFTIEVEKVAEPMNLTTFKWMKQQASQTKAAIVGSFVVMEKGSYYNRLIWMFPDGSFQSYDKRHLFRMENEHKTFSLGKSKLIVEWKGWRFCPLICYDLRFPVWSRNKSLEYDCLIYVANWPASRISAWETLLQARAIENLSYCVGVNRVGEDGNGIAYNGESNIIDFKGNELLEKDGNEEIKSIELNLGELHAYRKKFPAHQDADAFELH